MTTDPSDKVAKLTSAQGLALMVLVEAGADGARGSRGMSEVSKAPWMSDLVNTRSVTKLIDLGLAKK